MRRRDIIIISVLLNAAVLSILFFTASNPESETIGEVSVLDSSIAQTSSIKIEEISEPEVISLAQNQASSSIEDELDNVLKEYSLPSSQLVENEISTSKIPLETVVTTSKAEVSSVEKEEKYIKITVKKGDALEKIARSNGTTVNELKRLNHLTSEKLRIGQVLKVPAEPTKVVKKEIEIKSSKPQEVLASAKDEPQYYTIKSGDNPWKIAKQFKVDFDELLRLNQLNEESARNLKIGDKIRVH